MLLSSRDDFVLKPVQICLLMTFKTINVKNGNFYVNQLICDDIAGIFDILTNGWSILIKNWLISYKI